jgi:hypothetical protein
MQKKKPPQKWRYTVQSEAFKSPRPFLFRSKLAAFRSESHPVVSQSTAPQSVWLTENFEICHRPQAAFPRFVKRNESNFRAAQKETSQKKNEMRK